MEPYQLKAQGWGITGLDMKICVLSCFFKFAFVDLI